MPEQRSIRARADSEGQFSPILLASGEFLAPVTLCSDAARGDASEALHGARIKIYYDGATLFAANLVPAIPALVDQVALPASWTPLSCPACLRFGPRVLVYDVEPAQDARATPAAHWDRATTVGDGAPLVPAALPRENPYSGQTAIWRASAVRPPAVRPPAVRTLIHARESSTAVPRVPPSAPQPKAPPSPAEAEPRAETTPSRHAVEPIRAPARASAPRRAWARFQREFRATKPAVRWTLLALPAIAWLTLEPVGERPTELRAEAFHATPPAPVASSPGKAANAVAGKIDVATPDPRAPAGPTLAPAVSSAPASSAGKPARQSKRSLEARAADAAARGAYAEAVALYQELAELYPQRSEFASAVRILRTR